MNVSAQQKEKVDRDSRVKKNVDWCKGYKFVKGKGARVQVIRIVTTKDKIRAEGIEKVMQENNDGENSPKAIKVKKPAVHGFKYNVLI